MTDKEAELLRDLEKAALVFVGDPHRYRTIAISADEMDAVKAALDALTVYRAQPQEAEGETVEVRAKVYLDLADGGLIVHEASHQISPRYRRHIATITARVPLPAIPTIPAKVVA